MAGSTHLSLTVSVHGCLWLSRAALPWGFSACVVRGQRHGHLQEARRACTCRRLHAWQLTQVARAAGRAGRLPTWVLSVRHGGLRATGSPCDSSSPSTGSLGQACCNPAPTSGSAPARHPVPGGRFTGFWSRGKARFVGAVVGESPSLHMNLGVCASQPCWPPHVLRTGETQPGPALPSSQVGLSSTHPGSGGAPCPHCPHCRTNRRAHTALAQAEEEWQGARSIWEEEAASAPGMGLAVQGREGFTRQAQVAGRGDGRTEVSPPARRCPSGNSLAILQRGAIKSPGDPPVHSWGCARGWSVDSANARTGRPTDSSWEGSRTATSRRRVHRAADRKTEYCSAAERNKIRVIRRQECCALTVAD